MLNSPPLDGAAIQVWRDNIKNDTFASYYQSMAVAIRRQEGSAAALPYAEAAVQCAARTEASAWLLRSILTDLGRTQEAEAAHGRAIGADPRYEARALRDIAAICVGSAALPYEYVAGVFKQAIAAARTHACPAILLTLQLELAAYRISRQTEEASEFAFADVTAASLTAMERAEIAEAAFGLICAAHQAGAFDQMADAFHCYVAHVSDDLINPAILSRIAEKALTSVRDESRARLRDAIVAFIGRLDHQDASVAAPLVFLMHKATRAGERALAELAAATLLKADPKQSPARFLLARERMARGDGEGALAVLRDGRNDVRVLAHLAMYLAALGRTDEALLVGTDAFSIAPTDAVVQTCAGFALVAGGRSEALLAVLEPATASGLGPTLSVALALHALGRYGESLALTEAVKEATTPVVFAMIVALKACILETMGQTGEAEQAFRSAAGHVSAEEMVRQLMLLPTVGVQMRAGLRRAGMALPELPG